MWQDVQVACLKIMSNSERNHKKPQCTQIPDWESNWNISNISQSVSQVCYLNRILQNSASSNTTFFFVEYEEANFITFMGCFLQYVYSQHKISSYLNYAYACEAIDNDLLEFVRQPVYKALWLLRHTAIEVHGLIKYLVGVKFLKAKFDP
jgi:hypothetical protein